MSTPAGWYPDPTGRHQNRWFDGDDWTDQIADGQTVGVDPVRGGAEAAAGGDATSVDTPTAADTATGVPITGTGPPVDPTQLTPTVPAPGAPPPGTPGQTYAGAPPTSSGGGVNKGLLIGGAVVIAAIVIGLVLVLAGGDDGGDDVRAADTTEEDDQSDSPDTTDEDDDPSASDLFDDMADDADDDGDDIFGTDDEPADDPADTVPDGSYPQVVIDNFNNSCTANGAGADFCQCIIDVLQRDVPYDRFVEIDQQLADDPNDVPAELTAAVTECQGG